MTNKVTLNNVDHHDLRVRPHFAAEHGDAVNIALLFPTELLDAAREYPILLRRNDQGMFFAVALLGFDRDENLFLDGTAWSARYVPAAHRRGPFSIVMQPRDDGAEPMIHVDLDDPRVGRDEGEPLFKPHGGNTPYLNHIAETLRIIHLGIEVAPAAYAALGEAGLIQPVKLELKLGEDRQYDLEDFFTIDQEALAGLDGAALERLNRAGFLALAFAVTSSLGNIGPLIERKNRKRGAG